MSNHDHDPTTASGLHYPDPRHGEPCPDCDGSGIADPAHEDRDCPTCHGTGKRGGDAEPVIEIECGRDGWYWRQVAAPQGAKWHGPYPTEADAVFAARCTLAGAEIEPSESYDGEWMVKLDGVWTEPYPTREAALIEFLDAKGEQP